MNRFSKLIESNSFKLFSKIIIGEPRWARNGYAVCLSSNISFTNTSAPVAAGGQRQPRNSQHTTPSSPSPFRCENQNYNQRRRRPLDPRRDRQTPNQRGYPPARRLLTQANGRNRSRNRVNL